MEIRKTRDGRFAYEELPGQAARLVRCYGDAVIWRLPEQVEGLTVTEAAPYLFSAGLFSEPFAEEAACGLQIEEVYFPDTLKKIGRYAFYNCQNLRALGLPGTCLDLGGGAFNGCRKIQDLYVNDTPGQKSCLKEILTELNEKLRVHYSVAGEFGGILLFPEYFEEAVENTPARILETRMHGVGHRYRYCFQETKLNCRDYDSERIFYDLRVQEKPDTVMELVLLRLCYPFECREEAREQYEAYVRCRMREAAAFLLGSGSAETADGRAADREELFRRFVRYPAWNRDEFAAILDEANRAGRTKAVSFLMEEKSRRFPAKRRSFDF